MRVTDYEFNRMLLLKAIRRAEPVARTDLVAMTGLAAGTVTELTADLVRRKVLIEAKSQRPSFGRPRLELHINAKAAHVVSVSSSANGRLVIELVDLKGDVVFSRTVRTTHYQTITKMAHQFARSIDDTLEAASVARADVSRIGILIHGIVDNQQGIVHWLATYPDRGVPMAALIEEHLKIPVVIDNSTNLLARAEHWFGEAEHLDDFSVLLIDLTLGSAHYVDGMLWSGAHGINPELGHVKIVSAAPRLCYCGARGCLAAHCSMFGVVAQLCEIRKEPLDLESVSVRFKEFTADALAGDKAAREIFHKTGALLGTVAANMLHERDPGRLIVIAFDADFMSLISETFSSAFKDAVLPTFHATTTVDFKLVDAAAHYRKGCAAMALEQIYQGKLNPLRKFKRTAKRSVNRKRPGK